MIIYIYVLGHQVETLPMDLEILDVVPGVDDKAEAIEAIVSVESIYL